MHLSVVCPTTPYPLGRGFDYHVIPPQFKDQSPTSKSFTCGRAYEGIWPKCWHWSILMVMCVVILSENFISNVQHCMVMYMGSSVSPSHSDFFTKSLALKMDHRRCFSLRHHHTRTDTWWYLACTLFISGWVGVNSPARLVFAIKSP